VEEIFEEEAELVARVAALDIGKATLTACVRVPHESKPGRRRQEVRTDLPRAFRTADLRLIHAAICCSRYSLWTCCGVRY